MHVQRVASGGSLCNSRDARFQRPGRWDQDVVKVWDSSSWDITDQVEPWDTWDRVIGVKGFPGGLIAFLQTSTDAEGCGFAAPTSVQAYAWPVLQAGKDLVGVAKTGSGKTLAFLLLGFIKLRRLKKKGEVDTAKGPALLCVTPTRELCYQIFSDTEKFGKPVGISAACAYGGAPKKDQEWAIKQGPDCLIATPGRLNDFINNWVVNLDQVRYAVLDEADRMLDMGFEPQIKDILSKVPQDRQTSMFTATWPRECRQIADSYIKNPTHIQIGSDDITTNTNITQHIVSCGSDGDKKAALMKILKDMGWNGACLVFCNTKRMCRDLAWEIDQDKSLGIKSAELHGDLDQRGRDDAMSRFKNCEVKALIATDLAARGLDLRSITVVVNYDAPRGAEDYVHRIGRTGRANDKGDAYTLLMSTGNSKEAANIRGIMEKAGQAIPTPQDLRDAENEKGGSSGWGKEDSWDTKSASWDNKEDKWWERKGDDKKDDADWWKKDDKKEEGNWWEKKDEKKDDGEWWKKDERAEGRDDGGDAVTPGSLIDSLLGGKRPADDEAEDAPPEKTART
ncbi:unnamed protein product [Prorocentrum cordatum]|uniref:RNA helicase n=1 Tax=Prorocentrum cordatum TaxID=2364126 RepID=A0ABN9VEU8_9DINO|nr:unnamed protein product [Polarella glacialis]